MAAPSQRPSLAASIRNKMAADQAAKDSRDKPARDARDAQAKADAKLFGTAGWNALSDVRKRLASVYIKQQSEKGGSDNAA